MKDSRLGREGIQLLQKEGRRLSTPLFLLYIRKNEYKRHRISVSVSKKEERTAVGRNRIKRRMRHAVKGVLRDSAPYQDAFIITRGKVKDVPWKELLDVCERSILKR